MKTTILACAVILACTLPLTAGAQGGRAGHDAPATRVYFRQAVSQLDTEYRGNGETLARFVRGVESLLDNPAVTVHAVVVETGASPEGGEAYNDRLAEDRAESIRSYLLERLPLAPYQIRAHGVGADWEGLWQLISAGDCPWRDAVLGIIDVSGVRMDPSAENKRACRERMMALDGGRAWRWMLENVFPDLRQGAGTLKVIASRPTSGGGRDTVVIIHEYMGPDADWFLGVAADRAAEKATRSVLEYLAAQNNPKGYSRDSLFREPLFALRTNLLLPLLNAGVEVPLGNRWSVGADWYWPWVWRPWMNRTVPAQARCFQFLGGTTEARYWFGNAHRQNDEYRKYRLLGHSVALVAGAGYYDFQDNWVGRQGEFVVVGADYTYAMPLGRGRTHMEFSIGAGLAYTVWRGYEVHETGGRLIGNWDDGSRWMAVPVKAGVSLVVPIFKSERKAVREED